MAPNTHSSKDDCNPNPSDDDIFSSAKPRGMRGSDTLESLAKELEDCCPDGENCPDNCEPEGMRAIDWSRIVAEIIPLVWGLIAKLLQEQRKAA